MAVGTDQIVKLVLLGKELGLLDRSPLGVRRDGSDVASGAESFLAGALDDHQAQFLALPLLQH